MIPIEEISCFLTNEDVINNLIREQYGIDHYSFVDDQDIDGNCEVLFKNINGAAPDKNKEQDLKWFKSGHSYGSLMVTKDLLQELCAKGVIIPGNYLVTVFW